MIKIDKLTNMVKQPTVVLCYRNYDRVCVLHPIDDLKIYVTANAVDEISFTIHKYNNGVEFEHWDKIKSLNIVYVEDFGYFEVAVDTTESDDTRKVVVGASIEVELAQIYIDSLEINGEIDKDISSNWTSTGAYIQTTIYNPSDPEHSLLHRLLSNAAHWGFGEISESITEDGSDSSTSTVHRTFNFTNTNVYDALQEIAKELDVVFTFDTVNRKINMYDLNKIGKDTTIFVSTQNLATDFTCTTNKDNVKNCFKIVGGDEMINNAIRAVNPSGTDRIFHIPPEQMEGMSDKLKAKLQAYEALCERNSEEYTEACENLYNAIDKVYELETSKFPDRQPDAETTAEKEVAKLTASNLGNIPVENLTTLYETGAKKAVKTIAHLKVDYRYEVSINSSSYNSSSHTWTGKFKVENPSDGTAAISANDVTVTFVEDEKSSMQSKIDELLMDVDISDDTDIDTFRENLKDYSKDYLSDYEAIYKECTDILREKGYANKSDSKNNFYELYRSYWEKWDACVDELQTRKLEVAKAEVEQHECEKKVEAFQHIMDFASNLGDCYKEFCLYRREDVYQNDNYISDGMNSSELLKNAKMLIEAATKELYKASILQTVYTANLNNLFTNPIYKPFYNNFELFNWIHADMDNKHVMLRLIGITYDFSAMEKIEVEFSEQVRNANGMTDIESILNQSKSMATSYSSTIKQAATGSSAGLEFSNMKKQGLNSALMNIKSANEEVTIDSKGINCKSMDQNGDYDSHQLQITGKNMVLTDDDWETARMAIGAGLYNDKEVYGVWCDVLVGNMIVGETLLIANSSGTFLVDTDGIIVKRMKLDMSNASGTRRIVIDPELDSILSIYTNSKQVFYVDTNGNMCMLGNLYVNNNNMYLKVDMADENIIEVGYGEIVDTGNENESDNEKVDTDECINMSVYRSMDGLDVVSSVSSPQYTTQKAILEKDGETYFLDSYNDKNMIKKYNKNKDSWDNLTTITNGYPIRSFIKTNRTDNSIYMFSYISSSSYLISRLDLDDCICHTICTISFSYSYLLDLYLENDTLYISFTQSGNTRAYLDTYTIPTEADDIQNILRDTHIVQNGARVLDFIPYNNSLYAIMADNNTTYGFLAKITDLSTLSHKIISNLDNIKTVYYDCDQYCSTIMNDKLYVFCTYVTNSNKYFIYDLITKEISEYDGNAKLECSTNGYSTGIFVFNDGEKVHLYDNVNVSRKITYNYYKHLNNNGHYLAHYVYDNNNTFLVDKNFKELDYGKNFRISSQNDYITIDDVIYEVESTSTYFGDNSTPRFEFAGSIRKLDTSNNKNNWEVICTFTYSSPWYGSVKTPIQSNSKDKIYFVTYGNYLMYYDLNSNKVIEYYSGKATDDEDFAPSTKIITHEGFGYLDETTMSYYMNRTRLVKVDVVNNKQTIIGATHCSALSNQIYLDGYFYFVGLNMLYGLYRTNIENGSTEFLYLLDENTFNIKNQEEFGFSIFHYKNKIQIFYSYMGVLSQERYEYNIKKRTSKIYTNTFQDLGFYNVDKAYDYRTCFLPMITTSTGVHIFVGYPSMAQYYTNGGYKHYVYTEGAYSHDPDDPDYPSLPSVDNPKDKIFYITNKGEGHFYGNIYAKDGIFKGEIVAKSLTLAPEVNIPENNISAFGIIRDDINGINEDIIDINGNITDIEGFNKALDEKVDKNFKDIVEGNVDLAKVIYEGDITTTAEEIDGNTKYTTKIPIGDGKFIENITYDSKDYILTNVGIGAYTDPTGETVQPYVMINKEGLLKANNAVIQGTVYATDGRFKGDIIANSLKLEPTINIPSSNVDGLDDLSSDVSGLSSDVSGLSSKISGLSSTLSEYKEEVDKNFGNIINGTTEIKDVVYNGNITTTKEKVSDNPEVYKVTTTIPTSTGKQEVVTYEGGDYILTNVGYGDKSDKFTMIRTDGLLQATNAEIKGTIYATAGQIAGFLISDEGQHRGNALESSHYSDVQTGYGTYLSAVNGDLWNYSSSGKSWSALRGGRLNMASYDPSTQSVGHIGSNYTILGNDGLHVTDVTSYDSTTNIYKRGSNTQVRSSGLIVEDYIGTDVVSTNVKKNGLFISDTLNYRTVQVYEKGLIVDCDDLDTGIHNTTEVRQDRVTTNGVALTSDRKAKENIAEIDDEISKQLILGLAPVTFNYKTSTRNRTHMGFIAQDVSSLCKELDMPDMSLYEARIKSEEGMSNDYVEGTDESELNWYLNYTELIAPLIKTVQLQNEEIEKQASEIADLKERLAKLEAILLQ